MPLTPHGSLLYSPQPVNGPSLEQDELIHILIQHSEPEIHIMLFSCVSYLHHVSEIHIFMTGLHLLHLPRMLLACLAHCRLTAQNIMGRVEIMNLIMQFYQASHHSLCQVKTFSSAHCSQNISSKFFAQGIGHILHPYKSTD
jgi:hypothetical protein